MSQQHEMILENTHTSGAEEWVCPTCGRRMTITWFPWKKIILEPGDVYAAHSASKGGLRLNAVEVVDANSGNDLSLAEDQLIGDRYLAPWQKWLDNIDMNDL